MYSGPKLSCYRPATVSAGGGAPRGRQPPRSVALATALRRAELGWAATRQDVQAWPGAAGHGNGRQGAGAHLRRAIWCGHPLGRPGHGQEGWHQPERGQIRVLRLAAPATACLGSPLFDRLCREPHGKTAAGAQASIVLSRVGYLLSLLGDAVPAVSVGLERHVGRLSWFKGSPLYQPTPRRRIGRPVQQDGAESSVEGDVGVADDLPPGGHLLPEKGGELFGREVERNAARVR